MRRSVLQNRIQVLSENRPNDWTTRLILGVKYGSCYDPPEKSGLAHLVEHMLFKGTKKRSKDQLLAEMPSFGGDLNAATDWEMLYLIAQIPSAHIERAIDIISDMAFDPVFTQNEMEPERNVVLAEIAEWYDNPVAYTYQLLLQALFKRHPIRRNILGDANSVNSLSLEDLREAHLKYFVPNNMVVGVFGSYDENQMEGLLGKFLKIKENRNVPKQESRIETRKPFKPIIIEERKGIDQAQLMAGFKTVAITHKDSYALDILENILGVGQSSRLFNELREKKGLAYTVDASHAQGSDWGHFIIRTAVKKRNIDKVRKTIRNEFAKLASKKIGDLELRKAKEMIKGSIAMVLDDTVEGPAFLARTEILLGNALKIYEYLEKVQEVSSEDVMDIVNKYVSDDSLSEAVLRP